MHPLSCLIEIKIGNILPVRAIVFDTDQRRRATLRAYQSRQVVHFQTP